MKKTMILMATCLLVCGSIMADILPSRLDFADGAFPAPGKSITLKYNPKGGPLEGEKQVRGIAYMYNFYKWELGDVEMHLEDSLWVGDFEVPANCGLVAFKFQNSLAVYGAKYDNNDEKSFGYQLMNEEKQAMPGAYLGWGLLRFPQANQQPRGYFGEGAKSISLDAMSMWLQRELQLYNANGRHIFDAFKAVIRATYPDSFKGGFQYMLSIMEQQPELTASEVEKIYYTYRNDIQDTLKADSTYKVLQTQYPKSDLMRWDKFRQIRFRDADYMMQLEKFLQEFPAEEWYKNRDSHDLIYRNVLRTLYTDYKRADETERALTIIPHMSFTILQDAFAHGPQYQIMKTPKDPNEYLQEAELLIDALEKHVDDGDYCYSYSCSPLQGKDLALQYLYFDKGVMAMIYHKLGRHADVVKVMESMDKVVRMNWLADGNECYLNSLRELGRGAEAQELLLLAAQRNVLTPAMYKDLEAYWNTLPKKEQLTSFAVWSEKQKDAEVIEKAKEELRGMIISDDFQPFSVEGINGGKLASSQFKKGEIVVIDFWALWCAPCIKALSGMQMAVDYYKGDPNVRFGFVMTQEGDANYKTKANALFERKGLHDMPIYIDITKEGKTGGDATFKNLQPNPSGIPCKVIIKDGKVRYRAEGYSGNPAQLMQEIVYVVENLKEEK